MLANSNISPERGTVPSPPAERPPAIAQDTLRLLYANSIVGLVASFVLATVVAITHWPIISHVVLVAWWGGMVLLTAARAIFIVRFRRSAGGAPSTSPWFAWHFAGTALSGVAWGVAGIFLFAPDSFEHQVFLSLTVAGMVAGAAPIHAASRTTFLAFALPACLPIIAKFFLIGDRLHVTIGTVGLLFLGIMTWLAWSLNRGLVKIFELNAERQQAEEQVRALNQNLECLVTERTSKLRESERLFRALAEVAPVGIFRTDTSGQCLYVNERLCAITGLSADAAVGLGWTAALHPDDRERVAEEWAKAVRSQREFVSEYRFQTTEQKTTWVVGQARPELDQQGNVVGYVGTVTDITEHMQVEGALRKAEEYNRILFENSPIGLVTCQLDGTIMDCNERYIHILGRSRSDVLGKTYWELTSKKYDEQARAVLETLCRTGRFGPYEKEYVHADGHLVPVCLFGTLIEKDGKLLAICSVEDITERKQAEEALQAYGDQIRQMQKMEAIGQLAGGVAHDFNNILTAILGNAEIAYSQVASDHPARANLMRILEAGNRASTLVQQILTFSHHQKFSRTVIALSPVVEEALALLRATLPAGVELTNSCNPATPPVLADATQIHQVLMNLCTNSWHAMEGKPGHIAVDLSPITLTQSLHSPYTTLPPGHYACLSVHDTGCGMDPDMVARIFDPFFTTKPAGRGTGLGLSVALGIVQGHDGGIVVNSQPDRGTTFSLYFPAAEAPANTRLPVASTPVQIQKRRCHLLYLDDEEMLVDLVRAKLEPLGYRITGYTKPTEALAAVGADPNGFDVAVTDYNMPGMSGIEVARALTRLRADLPVVLVSGYLSPETRTAAFDVEIKEIVYKPSMLQQLEEVVARLIDTPPHT